MFNFGKKSFEKFMVSPMSGKMVSVREIPDEVFSEKIIGDGAAVIPDDDTVVAPIDGEIVQVADTGHAFCIHSDDGLDVLLHIGVDTVNMKGTGFEPCVSAGQKVKMGEKIVITGFNGIGKSTLIKTLMGTVPAISGKFKFADYVKIAYYEQDLVWENGEETPIDIITEHFPNMTIAQARKALARCGINSKNALQRIKSLSGGEQSKVKLCVLVNTKSNFLILDEPTNHLDKETKKVLKEQLINWSGNLILVSHEHDFYEDIVTKCINLQKLS